MSTINSQQVKTTKALLSRGLLPPISHDEKLRQVSLIYDFISAFGCINYEQAPLLFVNENTLRWLVKKRHLKSFAASFSPTRSALSVTQKYTYFITPRGKEEYYYLTGKKMIAPSKPSSQNWSHDYLAAHSFLTLIHFDGCLDFVGSTQMRKSKNIILNDQVFELPRTLKDEICYPDAAWLDGNGKLNLLELERHGKVDSTILVQKYEFLHKLNQLKDLGLTHVVSTTAQNSEKLLLLDGIETTEWIWWPQQKNYTKRLEPIIFDFGNVCFWTINPNDDFSLSDARTKGWAKFERNADELNKINDQIAKIYELEQQSYINSNM